MTERQALQRVRHWRRHLAPEWEVKVVFKDCGKAAATVERHESYLRATLQIDPWTLHHDDVERTIVHELLHLTVFDYADEAERLAEALGGEAKKLALGVLCAHEERVVDRLAVAFLEIAK